MSGSLDGVEQESKMTVKKKKTKKARKDHEKENISVVSFFLFVNLFLIWQN